MDRVWRIADRTAFVDGTVNRVILLNLDHADESPRVITGSGAVIWQLLCGEDDLRRPIGERELVSLAAASYDLPAEAIAQDIGTFLKDLAEHGFISPVIT